MWYKLKRAEGSPINPNHDVLADYGRKGLFLIDKSILSLSKVKGKRSFPICLNIDEGVVEATDGNILITRTMPEKWYKAFKEEFRNRCPQAQKELLNGKCHINLLLSAGNLKSFQCVAVNLFNLREVPEKKLVLSVDEEGKPLSKPLVVELSNDHFPDTKPVRVTAATLTHKYVFNGEGCAAAFDLKLLKTAFENIHSAGEPTILIFGKTPLDPIVLVTGDIDNTLDAVIAPAEQSIIQGWHGAVVMPMRLDNMNGTQDMDLKKYYLDRIHETD